MNIIDFRLKVLRLPKPTEVGADNDHSLPVRMFNSNGKYTWEDYEDHLKANYPVRFFLSYTLVHSVIYPIRRALKDAWWWIKYHTTHRYHMLDLRQPKTRNGEKNTDHYSHGWIDSDNQMVYAMFNILCNYVEHEFKYVRVDELQTEDLNAQYEMSQEIKALYQYWTVDRNKLQKQYDEAIHIWWERRHNKNEPIKEGRAIFHDEISELEAIMKNTEDEMCMRLLAIRNSLWT